MLFSIRRQRKLIQSYSEHEQCHDRIIDHTEKRCEYAVKLLTPEVAQMNPHMRASRFDTGV